MTESEHFDRVIRSNTILSTPVVTNLAEMIFDQLPYRNEDSFVLYGHLHGRFKKISLQHLRSIIVTLYMDFQEKQFHHGETVLLASYPSTNPLPIIVLYLALTSYGIRVLLPTYIDTVELEQWINLTKCTSIILPESEITQHNGNEKESISKTKTVLANTPGQIYDVNDFKVEKLLSNNNVNRDSYLEFCISQVKQHTDLNTESTICTTSGTAGNLKLLVFNQEAFIKCCTSWQESGLFENDVLGGRSFIDFFPHTISLRAVFNALWTGKPVCVINADYFSRRPVKSFLLLSKMKPENMTLGPSSFRFLLNQLRRFPLAKSMLFQDLKTIVSTGKRYDFELAEDIKKHLGRNLYNAYGTTESQQVLTSLLNVSGQKCSSLGMPLAGVIIGLKRYQEDLFKIFICSPFCCQYQVYGDGDYLGFWDSGDIVRIDENNELEYVGREKSDFFNTGFGYKISLNELRDDHKGLHEKVDHIEYYADEKPVSSFGLCVLLFVNHSDLSKGVIVEKNVLDYYEKIILKVNSTLEKSAEPYESLQKSIIRFMVINDFAPETLKGTVSKSRIESKYVDQITALKKNLSSSIGVRNVKRKKSF